jgi:energy-coupling factor transport system ATP-binding protein
MMAFLSLQNVSFAYPDGLLAVDNISIDIERGENIAIVGRNGAGKTTTAKLCNRLLCPSAGNVIIDGKNTRNYRTAQISRIAGYVAQNPDDQIFHATVEKEVAFGPKMMGLPPERVEALINEALNISGLEGDREENPYDLPLSIRKFITIASVIAMDTELMILDEPTAGQDLEGSRRLGAIIKRMLEKGKTLITISHDMEFVADNFSRIIVMADKRVAADGGPEAIFWNFDALEKARLAQPCVSRICRRLDIGGNIVHTEDAVNGILERI